MLDVDNYNPLNRFLLKKDDTKQLADDDIPVRADSKVVPIKPPRLRTSPLKALSVTQLLLIPEIGRAHV